MKKQKFKLEVTMLVEVEVDCENDVVKDYDSMDELLSDIVSHRFSPVLPVIQSGVALSFEDSSFEVLDHGISLV